MDALVSFVTDLIYNVTSMPAFLNKKEVVVISSENLEQIYHYLLLKTLVTTFFMFSSMGFVAYKMLSKPSVATEFVSKEEELDAIDNGTVPDIDDLDSDISDAKSEYSDGSTVSVSDVEKTIQKDRELVVEMSKKMEDDLAINSAIYQNARRSSRFK